jgi:hypothetical protein
MKCLDIVVTACASIAVEFLGATELFVPICGLVFLPEKEESNYLHTPTGCNSI